MTAALPQATVDFVREAIRKEKERRAIEDADNENIERDREECKNLHTFVQRAWHVVEPFDPFITGWVIQAKCDHLTAVTLGQILRLIINEPPGLAKSMIVSVLWPAWEWGPLRLLHMRYLCSSFALPNVVRDNLRMRRLVQSAWFQARWPTVLVSDQNAKLKFENDHTGFREGRPFGSLTGGRGHRVIIDDPHSTEEAESEAHRASDKRIIKESLPSRVNDIKTSAIVAVLQRLHQQDFVGIIEELGLKYEKLILPMEFDPEKRCTTSIGFRDPRTKFGELLFEERFPRAEVEELKLSLGPYGIACQLQQEPIPRGGGLFQEHWFKVVDAAPADLTTVARGWDIAANPSDRASACTASLKMAYHARTRSYYVLHCMEATVSPHGLDLLMSNLADQDEDGVIQDLPQDPGAAGKIVIRYLVANLAGHNVKYSPESGDKEKRASLFAAQAEAGNVFIVRGQWNRLFLDRHASFPTGTRKDVVDAASRAFARVMPPRRKPGGVAPPIMARGEVS